MNPLPRASAARGRLRQPALPDRDPPKPDIAALEKRAREFFETPCGRCQDTPVVVVPALADSADRPAEGMALNLKPGPARGARVCPAMPGLAGSPAQA